uniref:Uncharacterized mitochondrial protein AtMg00860-like n=1 Tax=Nicotiana tabacum TaxID=4097 RepID=A0A1S3ZNJ9_TOBAC|nr:PREDICTED: uncharacterized mitochondrial protein AtMg00860-like [Nicotiana tabacum]
MEHLRKVFQVMRENELYIKREKSEFAQSKVHFLGHVISNGELCMDEAKVHVIQEWEAPIKVTELRSFLGLVNYYCRFISGYSAKAAPLTKLLKKNKPWIWMEHCQKAFECRKTTDEHPIAFESHKLNETERRYMTQKKLSPKQARWQDFMAKFYYALEYKPGKGNVVADALSRKIKLAAITSMRWDIREAIKEGKMRRFRGPNSLSN